MESLLIKMVKGNYPKDKDIKNLLRYIAGKGKKDVIDKVLYVNARGVSRDADEAAKQFIRMQSSLGKNKNRRCYQVIVSFPESIDDKNIIIIIAEWIADKLFEEHQVYYGIHRNTENIHIHFAINAVSYVDGYKWHQSKKELYLLKIELLISVNKILNKAGYEELRLHEK